MLLLKKKIQPQKGQILVLTVILLPLLLIMTIFIIEAGFLYIKQSQLQNAADAIAVARVANDETQVNKLVEMNRTIDFKELSGYTYDGNNSVVLKEEVVPIFSAIFGENVIATIEVSSP